MYYLIDAGSSSIKIYSKSSEKTDLIEKKSYQLKNCYSEESNLDITENDANTIIDVFLELKNKYNLSKSNTKIYATGHFRNIKNRKIFVEKFYEQIGLYFNIIGQDLEAFYLEKKLSSYSEQIGRTLIFNIGGDSTELILCDKGNIIETQKLPLGVNIIRKEQFPKINEVNDSSYLMYVVQNIIKQLPKCREKFDTAIYTGGELTFMRIVGYPLETNYLFEDINHPSIISISRYISYNEYIFDKLSMADLLSKMSNNPTWMLGARACSAIAQAICQHYGVKQIIPSDFNMIDGIASQEARTAVICGSFNKHLDKISSLIELLSSKGIKILSPQNTTVVDNKNGFVLFKNDKMVNNCKWSIELCHLKAIRECDMVIVCNFDNYIGFSTAFEVGYSYSNSKKIVFLENNIIANNFDCPSEIGLLCI